MTSSQPSRAPHVASSSLEPHHEELVLEHLVLVGHVVRELSMRLPAHVDRDDLVSSGYTALVLAARSFDETRGVPFARYASTRVRGAVLDELRGADWAPRSVRRRERDLDTTRATLTAHLGRSPSEDELARAAGLSRRELADHQHDLARSSVLSVQGVGERPLDDLLSHRGEAAHVPLEQRERLAYLADAVATLPERLRTIVEATFFHDRPMAELAAELGVTVSRVSQLRTEALGLLRGAMNAALDPDLLARPDGPAGRAQHRRESYFAAVAGHRTWRERLSHGGPAAHDASRGAATA